MKKKDSILRRIEKKYGITLEYDTDEEFYSHLEDSGIPSLVKLIKLI